MSNSNKNEKIWVIIMIENSAPKPVRNANGTENKQGKK